MKVAYIAGPYRGKSKIKIINYLQRQINIHRAAEVAKAAWLWGWAVICPHKNSGNFDSLNNDLMFLNGDIDILRRCDTLILVPGWQQSKGAREEVKTALDAGIKTFVAVRHNGNFHFIYATNREVDELLKKAEKLGK